MYEVIILAGGLGTRLRSAVPNLPKCMAPVNGKPFIGYVIEYFKNQGVTKFIFSLGYMHEVLTEYISTTYPTLSFQFVIEEEPLGTGGAIKFACTKATEKQVFVTNGDTLFTVDISQIFKQHLESSAVCTLALKPMFNFERYGVVEIDSNERITSFKEKKHYETGLINGGLYLLDVSKFLEQTFPDKFSFEKEFLESTYQEQLMNGVVQNTYFIDIGIPEDYKKVQIDFLEMKF